MAAFQVWVTIQKKKFDPWWNLKHPKFVIFFENTAILNSFFSLLLLVLWFNIPNFKANMNLVFLKSDIPSILSDQPWKNSKTISVHLSDFTFSIPFQVYVPNYGVLKLFCERKKKFHWNLLYGFEEKGQQFLFFSFFFLIFFHRTPSQ